MSSDYEQHQQQLLTTIVKWTNAIILAAVLLNSYFLLTEFWKTLAQNLLSLAIPAIGLGCLRLSRRGHLHLAVRVYLGSGMFMASLLVLILSPSFVLNGALGLGLFVLIATYLDEPEAALRWGGISILLYAAALTARVLGPFEELGLGTADLIILYILPAMALLAFALLGRSATGHIIRTLRESEAARHELERSHQALQRSEAALTESNEQLQIELAEHERTEEALRQSLEDTARDQSLLLALSQAAQSVQQARTPEEVYRTIGDQIGELGYGSIVLRPGADGAYLEIAYAGFDPSLLAQVDELLGFPILGYRIPQAPGSIVGQVLAEGRTVLTERYADLVAAAFPGRNRSMAREMAEMTGMDQAITAPLSIDDQVLGLLIVTGTNLAEDDRRAVSAFASQAAIALTNVRLLQEIRDWAAELEHRVQERTADLAASEARYRRLFDSNRDALYVIDLQGRILDANPASCHLLGYDREELLTIDVLAIDAEVVDASPDGRVRFLEQMQSAWRQGMAGSERFVVTRDGNRIPVELNLTPVTYQGSEAALAAVRDITDRKRAEEALRRSQEVTVQNHQRLLALSQSAQAVQRARTVEEVYRVIGHEVKQLGFQAAVLRMTQDPSSLAVAYWTFDSALLRAAEKAAGRSAQDIRIRLNPDEALQPLLARGESVFFQNTADRIARGVPRLGRVLIERLVSMLGIDRSIYSPLRIGGATQGILMVAGRDLNQSDVPAIAILANQAGIAIENAQLLEEQQASRARMQRLARQVVSAQEKERQRISHILHDESGQALTALRISLELIAQDLPAELDSTSRRILDAAALTGSTMERIRMMAQDLRPPALDTIGLSPTLESFCQDFARRTQIDIDYQGEELPPLPEPASITMYRFLQEALTNVARHARADQVRVALERSAGGLTLLVEDNGEGFDVGADESPAKRRTSMGLESMRERLESLGGTLEIESRTGQGTRLSAFIPVQEGSGVDTHSGSMA